MRSRFFVKGYFALPPKNIKCSDYLLPFKLLFRDINSLNFSSFIKNMLRVNYGIVLIHLLNKFQKFLTKICQNRNIKKFN